MYLGYVGDPMGMRLTSIAKQMKGSTEYFPPPADWWPAGSACSRLDWRHLSAAKAEDVSECKRYISDWTNGHVTAVMSRVRSGKMSPCLAVLEAVATKDIPVGADPVAAEAPPVDRRADKFQFEADAGKVHYIEWHPYFSGARMEQVAADEGTKRARGLTPADQR